MKTRSYLALVVIVALAFFIGSATKAQEGTKTDESTQLTELLGKRLDVLLQLVETLEYKFSQGRCKVDSVVAVREQLLDAELQLTTHKTKRLEILQKRIDNMRQLEDSMKTRHQTGNTTLETLLVATAARLKAEIDFVREKG